MELDVERIIQSMKHGDQACVWRQLKDFNTQFAHCFFLNTEERERKTASGDGRDCKFRQNKVRDEVPHSDSDFDSSDSEDSEDPDLVLRQRLAAALICFISMRLQPRLLRVCLCTLRILSRDRQALAPLTTDNALLTLAYLGGLSLPLLCRDKVHNVDGNSVNAGVTEAGHSAPCAEPDCTSTDVADSSVYTPNQEGKAAASWTQMTTLETKCKAPNSWNNSHQETEKSTRKLSISGDTAGALARKGNAEEEDEGDDGEVWRREAIKTLCNIIYNSQRAQERASALRLLRSLSERLKAGVQAPVPPSGQFYELRLLFLLTALRPELRLQLRQDRGVSMLTAALEQHLSVQWGDSYELLTEPTTSPIPTAVSQHVTEILKTLFNITHSIHRQELDEEEIALYRRLVAVLRHCLLLFCDGEEKTEELQGHTVNVLSVLPLRCLDVLISTRLSEVSHEREGITMDSVHALLLFMKRRLDRGQRLPEKLIPILTLLSKTSREHRESRHYLRQQILPPLRDVTTRPERDGTVRGQLIRLMTHVDTAIKHHAAELLFILCKENVHRFVKYTGYGNAAGLLAARGLLCGGNSGPRDGRYSSDSDSDTEEYQEARARINQVTGCVEEEQPDPTEGMTEEEKEAEAQKLIYMFSRLSRDKIIQPAKVTSDGSLAPLTGHLQNYTLTEQSESEEE